MELVPKAMNLDFLIGTQLNQIGLGPHDVQFVFDCTSKICVQSRAKLSKGNAEVSEWAENGWSNVQFQQVLGQIVSGYSFPEGVLLQVDFENDLSLRIFEDPEWPESLQIYPPDPSMPTVVL